MPSNISSTSHVMYDDMFYILHILSFQKTSILPIPPLDGLINLLSGWQKFPPWGNVDIFWNDPFFVYFNLFKHY